MYCVGASAVVAHLRAVDAVRVGLGGEEAAVVVVADQADGLDRQRRVELLDVDGEVAGRAAAARLDLQDLDRDVLARPELEQLVAVDAPGAGRDDAATPLAHPGSALPQGRLGDAVVVLELASVGRMPCRRSSSWYAFTASAGATAPSATCRISATMASGDSARLILRPNRATRAP